MDDTKKSVNDLQEKIEKTQLEGAKHQTLEEIKSLIQLIVNNPDDTHKHTLKENLEEALLLFDAEHHELVTAMKGTINTLSNSGV